MAYMQTNVNRIRCQHNVYFTKKSMTAALMRTNYASLYPVSSVRTEDRHGTKGKK